MKKEEILSKILEMQIHKRDGRLSKMWLRTLPPTQGPWRKVWRRKIQEYSTSFISPEISFVSTKWLLCKYLEMLMIKKPRKYWAKMEQKLDHTGMYYSRPYVGNWFELSPWGKISEEKVNNYKTGIFFWCILTTCPFTKMFNYKCQQQPSPFKAKVFPGTFLIFGKWHGYYLNRMLLGYLNSMLFKYRNSKLFKY